MMPQGDGLQAPTVLQVKDLIPSLPRTESAVGLARCHMTQRLKQNNKGQTQNM